MKYTSNKIYIENKPKQVQWNTFTQFSISKSLGIQLVGAQFEGLPYGFYIAKFPWQKIALAGVVIKMNWENARKALEIPMFRLSNAFYQCHFKFYYLKHSIVCLF